MTAVQTRAERLRHFIDSTQQVRAAAKAEALTLRKIGNDLLATADKLEARADEQAQQILDWQRMLAEEEARP